MIDRVSQHVTPYKLNRCLSVLVSFSKQLDPLKRIKSGVCHSQLLLVVSSNWIQVCLNIIFSPLK